MAVMERDLWSFEYPEFKTETCVTGWTYMPCPTWSNPGRMCKQDITGICTKTKTSRFRVYVRIEYPDSAEAWIREQIDKCHYAGAEAAATVIIEAATASSVVGPVATISAAIASIPAAAEAYGKAFYGCIEAIQLSQVYKDLINATIHHEDKGITDWRQYDSRQQYLPNYAYMSNHIIHFI